MSKFIAIDHEMISMDIINSIELTYSFDDEYVNNYCLDEEEICVYIHIITKEFQHYSTDFMLYKNKDTGSEFISNKIFTYISNNDVAVINDIPFIGWTTKGISRHPYKKFISLKK